MPSLDEPVTLCPYQADWPARFAREQARLAAALAIAPLVIEYNDCHEREETNVQL